MALNLPPETERRLKEVANRQGIDVDELLRSLLNGTQIEESLARQTALASELTLAKIWDTPEEDEAWRHL